MTLKQLKEHFVSVRPYGHGHYKVTIEYRNKEASFITTNTLAVDSLNEDGVHREHAYSTPKQAYSALYAEFKRKCLQM